MNDHSTFATRDYWGAAFLHLSGAPLLRVETGPDGRANFIFANDNDQAYQAFLDWKAGNGRDMVPLQSYRQSYRTIQNAAHRAREEDYGTATTTTN